MELEKVLKKLAMQDNPQILMTDIDGTLFSPNLNLLTAPLFNTQTTIYLKKKNIPFVIVTGRSFWRRIDQYHLRLLGVPRPDIVVTANGAAIYSLQKDRYVSDFTWQGILQATKITQENGKVVPWNKWDITDTISDYFTAHHFPFVIGRGNTYLIRLRVSNYPVATMQQIRKDLLTIFPKGLRIILTEKLLWKNSLSVFSGEMLITPSTAGKDKAVQYLLRNLSTELGKPIHAFLFGDASVDIPMLTMKEEPEHYTLSQYAVHPTPLAKAVIEEKMPTHPTLHLFHGDGPREILWTLRPELRKKKIEQVIQKPEVKPHAALDAASVKLQENARPNSEENFSMSEQSKSKGSQKKEMQIEKQPTFSPAQNNKARQVIRKFEWLLDKLVDKNLSPNEVSFLGLEKLSYGLTLLHKKNSTLLDKTKGLYHYSFGNLTDVLDGIRARNSDKREENGAIIDGFSDRAKEFMQLYHRAKIRVDDADEGLPTFLAAISCALPSIAREQVETMGKAVPERDEKGGSMIDRTKRLFLSLVFTMVGSDDQSFATDQKIFDTNIATFHHRLTYFTQKTSINSYIQKLRIKDMNDFQKTGLEKFLLYVDVLQQGDAIIKKYLAKHKEVLKQYEKESHKLAKNYLQIPIKTLRKKFEINDFHLEIKQYV